MTIKEVFDSHLKKSSAHHDALAKSNRALAKSHSAAANACDQGLPTLSRHHRDLSEHHENLAKAHQARQADFEALRENLAEASDATVLDKHEGETRNMQHALGYSDLLKAMRLLPAD